MDEVELYKAGLVGMAKEIPGWCRLSELRWLADQSFGLGLVVEMGSWLGRSTQALSGASMVVCCDSWATESGLAWAREDHLAGGLPFLQFFGNHRESIENGNVVPYVMDLSHVDFIERLVEDYGGRADMVFIDANHTYEAVKRDIATAKRLLKPGGIMCGHDYGERDWPGVKQAVDELFSDALNPAGSIWVVK